MVTAEAFVSAEQVLRASSGRSLQRTGFAGHHVLVEIGRTTNRLAGVIDDEIEPRARGEQVTAKGLHTRRVAQVQAENFQAVAPIL